MKHHISANARLGTTPPDFPENHQTTVGGKPSQRFAEIDSIAEAENICGSEDHLAIGLGQVHSLRNREVVLAPTIFQAKELFVELF